MQYLTQYFSKSDQSQNIAQLTMFSNFISPQKKQHNGTLLNKKANEKKKKKTQSCVHQITQKNRQQRLFAYNLHAVDLWLKV